MISNLNYSVQNPFEKKNHLQSLSAQKLLSLFLAFLWNCNQQEHLNFVKSRNSEMKRMLWITGSVALELIKSFPTPSFSFS